MKVPFASFLEMEKELNNELRNAFETVLKNSWYIAGKMDEAFENEFAEYCETDYCVGCGNGLDALMLALLALGIGEGDEVIVPANSFVATALAVSRVGAKPVMVDPNIDTYTIDINQIEPKINSHTKAIIPVHLYGRPCDMDGVMTIAKRHKLYVVEDCAQAHGARYKGRRVGSFGDVGAFSFYPGKNLGALGDGGAIVTNNSELADRIRSLGNYGSGTKYHHKYLGTNSRLDELQAAFLSAKLPLLDKMNQRRNEIANKYIEGISNPKIVLPTRDDEVEQVWHIFSVRCQNRDSVSVYLEENEIGTNRHYPVPIHLQECYNDLGYKRGDLPVSELISDTQLSLPMYYGMTDTQVNYIIEKINEL